MNNVKQRIKHCTTEWNPLLKQLFYRRHENPIITKIFGLDSVFWNISTTEQEQLVNEFLFE